MKPRITVITLGVNDLEKSLAFYRDGLGLATQGIVGTEFEHGAVAFFDLHNGVKLALWPAHRVTPFNALAVVDKFTVKLAQLVMLLQAPVTVTQ